MGELQVTLVDGAVDVFVDEVIGEEPGNPSDGAHVSHFLFDRSQVDCDRFVVIMTQVDVDLRRRCPAEVVGCVEIARYLGAEWRSARWVCTGDAIGEIVWADRRSAAPRDYPPGPRRAPDVLSLPGSRQLVARP